MENVEGLMAQLQGKDNTAACGALGVLLRISEDSDAVYPYFHQIARLMSHPNSLMRNRALLLLAANARWDTDALFDSVIDEYLTHIVDAKPITARQCVKGLPEIAREKPQLANKIRLALLAADVSGYSESMRPLVERDIAEALQAM